MSRCRRAAVALALLVGGAAPVAAQDAVEYYGTDAIGSVRIVFTAAGAVAGRMDYGPFGEELVGATAVPTDRFAGTVRDGETEQDYAQARMYTFRTGRFSAPDPVYAGANDPQQWNRYAYARNNPVSLVDPEGLLEYVGTPQFTDTISVTAGFVHVDMMDAWLLQGLRGGFDSGYQGGGRQGGRGGGSPNAPPAPLSPTDPDDPEDPGPDPDDPDPSDPCADVPDGPGGRQTINNNISIARVHPLYSLPKSADAFTQSKIGALAPVNTSAVTWFTSMVKPGGPWDYKRNNNRRFEAFGNFNYGATGAAMGYSSATLLAASLYIHLTRQYQPLNTENLRQEYGDQKVIALGVRYLTAGCAAK